MSKTPFVIATACGAATAWLYHHYWHQTLPQRRYRQVQQAAANMGTISGGWITHTPSQMAGGDVLLASYSCGLIIDGHPQPFTISANGALLRWG
ncbi:MAG: hypothetical protein LKJ69_00085 [Lactobacillus sp.]|nr:hypothetical protein [Lactobacillus sp.]MCI2031778.1 hypothetical protein [Lactobacillus sp.]